MGLKNFSETLGQYGHFYVQLSSAFFLVLRPKVGSLSLALAFCPHVLWPEDLKLSFFVSTDSLIPLGLQIWGVGRGGSEGIGAKCSPEPISLPSHSTSQSKPPGSMQAIGTRQNHYTVNCVCSTIL